jgi:hypothetical protein
VVVRQAVANAELQAAGRADQWHELYLAAAPNQAALLFAALPRRRLAAVGDMGFHHSVHVVAGTTGQGGLAQWTHGGGGALGLGTVVALVGAMVEAKYQSTAVACKGKKVQLSTVSLRAVVAKVRELHGVVQAWPKD